MDAHLYTHQLEYITKGHIAIHTILFQIKNGIILLILSGIAVLNNIVLIITQSHLSIAQVSSSFKHLNTRMFRYAIPTLIIEALCHVTRVQLLLMTVTVNNALYSSS